MRADIWSSDSFRGGSRLFVQTRAASRGAIKVGKAGVPFGARLGLVWGSFWSDFLLKVSQMVALLMPIACFHKQFDSSSSLTDVSYD